MGKKRKQVEREIPEAPKKDDVAAPRPKRTLLGWKDKTDDKETDYPSSPVFRNREKVLVTCSRRIAYRFYLILKISLSLSPSP